MPTNNTGEIEALGHALAWTSTLAFLDGEVLLIADNSHALAACQALQRCSANTALVQAVRRAWRREAERRVIRALHVKGHSGNPWNDLVDSLATAAMRTA
jgi:ribonuclease HI